MSDQLAKVLIHLHSGQTITTFVDDEEIGSSEDLLNLLEGAPRWRVIGADVVVHSQAVAGIELG